MLKKQKHKYYKFYVRLFWVFFTIPFLMVALLMHQINEGKFGYMPDIKELQNPKSNMASVIYASDQKVLGKYFFENRVSVDYNDLSPFLVNALIATEDARYMDHSGIDGKSLLRVLVRTLIMGDSDGGGGSTISQQLAKLLFERPSTIGLSKLEKIKVLGTTKLKEWIIAIKLERNYSKQEIIAMYFNTFDFLNLAVGIKSAAKIYFDTTPDKLNLEQSAMLVGMAKNPAIFNPRRYLERTRGRRNTVLDQMLKYNYLDSLGHDSLCSLPLVLNFKREDHKEGLSPYFREYLRLMLTAKKPDRKNYNRYRQYEFLEDSAKWEDDPIYGWCNKNTKPNGEPYNLYTDGLKLYTTINSKMQHYAEEAVSEHMKDLQKQFVYDQRYNSKAPFSTKLTKSQRDRIIHDAIVQSERYRVLKKDSLSWGAIEKNFHTPLEMNVFSWAGDKDTVMTPYDSIIYYKYFLHAGFMSVEPKTGFVRAYVGGINFNHFQFDNVTGSKRQVGSTFKPFIYTLAMIDGKSPCFKVPNTPVSFNMPAGSDIPIYTPTFSTAKYLEKYEGKMITLKFGLAHSLNQVSARVLKKYGAQAAINTARAMGVTSYLTPVPSLCVGAAEVRLAEMVGAYTTFANRGLWVQPIVLTRIEDKKGNVIAQFKPQRKEAINEETAYLTLELMKGVVDLGTSRRLRYKYKFENEIAGKTGTTNDNSDGWFIGITQDLVSGAWVGGEMRAIRFVNGKYGQGAHMALPIWALYMKQVYADEGLNYPPRNFDPPSHPLSVETDCDVYDRDSQSFDGMMDDDMGSAPSDGLDIF